MIEKKRLFFGGEIEAPWPENLPQGRQIDPEHRHLTFAFLGNVDPKALYDTLEEIPPLPFTIGPVGTFDECLFLPPRKPRVVSWHIDWDEHKEDIEAYIKTLSSWLKTLDYTIDERPHLPHVTLCRSPFDLESWKKGFYPLPCVLKGLYLYESVGQLQYEKRWEKTLMSPFEELEHTADLAFTIRGKDFNELYIHARGALAHRFPPLSNYPLSPLTDNSIEGVIHDLNTLVTQADIDHGCPFKAVTYHSQIEKMKHIEEDKKEKYLSWEMIIDV